MFLESNPIPVKAALALAGLCDGEIRLPLTRAGTATIARLAPLLAALLSLEDAAADLPRFSVIL